MAFAGILTERLALRDLRDSDAGRIFEYRSRPEVSRFQSWGTESSDEIRRYIRGIANSEIGVPGSWHQIGIDLLASHELIGDCGLRVLDTDPRQAEIGITLAPEHQSRGYATEAVRALLDYIFTTFKMHRVFASVDPRNLPSIHLMERVGMRKEAHFIESLWFKDEWVDDVVFAMLASDWKDENGSLRL
jgi:RimJ/RimL family protein N-acetyltransferase